VDQALAVGQASGDGDTKTQPAPFEGKEPGDHWSVSEDGDPGAGLLSADCDRELRAQEGIGQSIRPGL
jgi:hypothetical protein